MKRINIKLWMFLCGFDKILRTKHIVVLCVLDLLTKSLFKLEPENSLLTLGNRNFAPVIGIKAAGFSSASRYERHFLF